MISHGANLAAVTETGGTAVGVIFDSISQPINFLTDVLNSCIKICKYHLDTSKWIYLEVRFALCFPFDQLTCIYRYYFLILLRSLYWILMNWIFVNDQGQLQNIDCRKWVGWINTQFVARRSEANGSSHSHYGRNFGYKETGNITASSYWDLSKIKVGEIKNIFLSSYTHTLFICYFSLELCLNIYTKWCRSGGDSNNRSNLFLHISALQYDSSYIRTKVNTHPITKSLNFSINWCLTYILKHFRYYLRQLDVWLSIICAILSLITSIAGEFVKCSKEEIKSRHCMDWVLHIISIAVLLSWMQMMLLISRVLMWGDYALMFYTVLKNILKVKQSN